LDRLNKEIEPHFFDCEADASNYYLCVLLLAVMNDGAIRTLPGGLLPKYRALQRLSRHSIECDVKYDTFRFTFFFL